MKKLFYAFLVVVIIYLASIIYRDHVTPILMKFPLKELVENDQNKIQLYLVLFFSRKSCPPCVQQVVNYLLMNSREKLAI